MYNENISIFLNNWFDTQASFDIAQSILTFWVCSETLQILGF